MPDLGDAVHRRAAAREAASRPACSTRSRSRRADVGPVHDRAVRARADHADPFDPRAERGRDPHAARHGAAYRRLEARPRPAGRRRRPTRPRCARLGDEGVLAMVCDSTNALRDGHVRLRGASCAQSLTELIGRYDGRVAVACFASNVARLSTIAQAARGATTATSRWSAARCGAWTRRRARTAISPTCRAFLTEDEAGYVPRDKILLICTGSQGEPRAALARIARDDHPHIVLERGDVVIFSSRIIPGNEKAIGRLQNALAQLRRRDRHRATIISSMSPAIRPRRADARCTRWCGRGSRCRCMARRAI